MKDARNRNRDRDRNRNDETVADYRMIAFPVDPGLTAEAVFGDLIGDYDPDRYRIGVYDPRVGGYIEYGEGVPIEPGRPV